MRHLDLLSFHAGILLIDFVGALLVVGFAVAAGVALLKMGDLVYARLMVAEGAILGLSFKTAGTLLKTIELHTWDQILTFGAILSIRVVLKQLFVWEKGRVEQMQNRRANAVP